MQARLNIKNILKSTLGGAMMGASVAALLGGMTMIVVGLATIAPLTSGLTAMMGMGLVLGGVCSCLLHKDILYPVGQAMAWGGHMHHGAWKAVSWGAKVPNVAVHRFTAISTGLVASVLAIGQLTSMDAFKNATDTTQVSPQDNLFTPTVKVKP